VGIGIVGRELVSEKMGGRVEQVEAAELGPDQGSENGRD